MSYHVLACARADDQKLATKSLSESSRKANRCRVSKRSLSKPHQRYLVWLTIRELHERLMLRNEQTKQVRLPEVYIEDDNAKANVSTWMNSQFIHEAVPNLLPVSLLVSC